MMSMTRSIMSASCKAGLAKATGTRFAPPSIRFQLQRGTAGRQLAYGRIVVRGTSSNPNAEMNDTCHEDFRRLLVPLYKDRVRYVVGKLVSRLSDDDHDEHTVTFQPGQLKDRIEASPELTSGFQELLQSTGCGQPLPDFTSGLDRIYTRYLRAGTCMHVSSAFAFQVSALHAR